MQIYLGARFFFRVCLYSVDLNNLEQLSLSRLPFNCDREALPNSRISSEVSRNLNVNRLMLCNGFLY